MDMTGYTRVTDCDAPELYWFSGIRDTLLATCKEYEHGLFLGESPKVIERALASGCAPLAMLIEEHWLEQSAELVKAMREAKPDLPVHIATLDQYRRITGFKTARGALALFERPAPREAADLLRDATRVVILENITSYTNIGLIFRSAAALGADAVLVTPSCHDPLYRRAARVSMGTVLQVPWAYIGHEHAWQEEGFALLHEHGFASAALALREDSTSLVSPELGGEERLAIIMGTEGDGLQDATIDSCDYTVCIPMDHGVDSLNVAAATSISLWELIKRPRLL